MDMLMGAKLLGGGGGEAEEEQWVYAHGTFTADSYNQTVEHGLGVVPDYMTLEFSGDATQVTSEYAVTAFGKSVKQAALEGAGTDYGYCFLYNPSTKKFFSAIAGYGIDQNSALAIRNANETTVTFGGMYQGFNNLASGQKYRWTAIGRAK